VTLDLYAELRQVVETLDRASIIYALAGGLAVAIYATPRATEDIDILVAPDHLDLAITRLEPVSRCTSPAAACRYSGL
jgi:hypothetical protein